MDKTSIDKKELVQQFGTKISRLSHRMIIDNERAKEAAQEVWYEIFRSIDRFRGDSGIGTWIYTIAKRTILRVAQSERILLKSSDMDSHFARGPIDYTGSEEERLQWVKERCDYCLTAFCHCLTDEARLVFLFSEVAELPPAQTAEIMEMTEVNVRQIASRSRKRVKSFMKKDCILLNPDGSCRCRISREVKTVQLEKEYGKLARAAYLIDLFGKFDRELPRKNYWEKILQEDVTNGTVPPLKG